MLGKTHIAGGIALASIVSLFTVKAGYNDIEHVILQQASILTSAGLGALWLDIDHKNSAISRQYPVISFIVRLFVTHRGATHSILFYLMFSLLGFLIAQTIGTGIALWIAIGFSIGYASHILLDSLNPRGVPLFYPLKHRYSFGKIVTGKCKEKIIFLFCIFISIICECDLIRMYI